MKAEKLVVLPDLEGLSEAAAELMAALAAEAIAHRGRFAVALSGGSTPRRLYQLLATPPWSGRIAWPDCHFFWGDERLVPPDHPESNFHLAQSALLARVPVLPHQIHRVPVETGEPEAVASAYEAELRRFFSPAEGETPRFDLVLLGLGSDGHTASLFPERPALEEIHRWVVATPPGWLPPAVDRVTLTLPVLNAARAVAFLVSGADKAPVLRQILEKNADLPAARVQPVEGDLYWFLDEAAAGQLFHISPRVGYTPCWRWP